MTVLATLQALADRLGLDSAFHRMADGRPRVARLVGACVISLALWGGIVWGLVSLARWRAELG